MNKEEFTSLDDYLNHFTSIGFKLVKDDENNETRTLTLRRYVEGEYSEATIKQSGSKISVIQTVDGKPII